MRILFVDNFDSFSYNVVHLLASAGAAPDVLLNDDVRLQASLLEGYDALVVGPGPGRPEHAPRMIGILRSGIEAGLAVLGVCLGLQAIGEVLGATVTHAPRQMHGKTSAIAHDGSGLFAGLLGLGDDSQRATGERAQRRRGRARRRASQASRSRRPVSP
jgi:anthranilate/para-aminobenzoate synthase component II